jgi:protein SCO1
VSGAGSIACTQRRALLGAGIGIGASGLVGLTACDKSVPPFNGVDLTGASWGKNLSLPDTSGQLRSLADFKGKVVSLFFGFLHCPDFCPTHLTRQLEVMRLLGADASKLQTLFVSVDPERDSPAAIKAYLAGFHPSFIGLTGSAAQLQANAKEFKAFFAKAPMPQSAVGYSVDHTTNTVVFDPSGQLRLLLRHDLSAAQVAADLKRMLA